MKRKLLFVLPLLSCFVYFACRKNEDLSTYKKYEDPFVAPALAYLKTKISNDDFKKLDLDAIRFLKNNEVTEGIIISYEDKLNQKSIILGKQQNEYIGNWISLKNINTANNGIIRTESFDGSLINEVIFKDGKALKIIKTDKGETKTTLIKYPKKESEISTNSTTTQIGTGVQLRETNPDGYNILPEVTVTAYVSTAPVNFYSLYWAYNQSPSYYYAYSSAPPSGGGVSSSNTGYVPIYRSPEASVDILQELKCFTVNSTAKYYITINVIQPFAGTRLLTFPGVEHKVGHTYITLEQVNPNGTTIVRNVGLYPATSSRAGSETSPAAFGDNSNMPASVNMKISVTGSELQTVKQVLVNQSRAQYNLSSFNCTTAAVSAFNSINIHLPATTQYVLGLFNGLNPGDLGEDIRNLDVNTFSSQNGNRYVLINKSSTNSLNPPAKNGTCL